MMEGFALLIGHLIGDYIVQNDWMAAGKTAPLAGSSPKGWRRWSDPEVSYRGEYTPEQVKAFHEYSKAMDREMCGHLACTVHCLLYTLAIWACSFSWMPWWGLLACFLVHWPIDRFRLARVWMERVSGQKAFANGPLSPWSIIIVDNTFHLLTLLVIAVLAGRY